MENPWSVLDKQDVYDNPWIRVTEYNVINPSGGKGIYGKVHFKNIAIGILVIDADQNTFLIGQYRFVLNAYSWEIPEGGCPEGSDPLESAKRELLEEAGLEALQWKELLQMHLSNSVSDELAIVFMATDLVQKTPQPEETEQLVIRKLPLQDALDMVERGTITDAISVAALQKAALLLERGHPLF
ncbi:8-oxo-dGTP pyrophosphatase MutT, NUDIX family [Niabella drilacis]|uniref:GDP-mannose pyrophosphatase n=2 Tax=Niabella drilacis (strain DSM 25811 / CCM 8410 / CCUG 62505 / LMG 26954 / E90) TaxID=1285928 RepID=A0A1G6R1N4_NIADE|nr:8-oxo-dGTP pyrophosphatase MutT, NUDIX family [Niabella drilacis]